MITETFRRTHPPITERDSEVMPVVSVQMPSEPSIKRFYTAQLVSIGAPVNHRQQ